MRFGIALWMCVAIVFVAACQSGPAALDQTDGSAANNHAPDIFAVNDKLGRGINLGNLLEAPREGDWGLSFDESFFPAIAQAGFNHMRVPVSWGAYADTAAPFTIPVTDDPTVMHPDYDSIFERVDWVIDQAESNGLTAIINLHHDDAINADPVGETDRFIAMWTQISGHYAEAGDHVVFELFNEPHGAFDDDPTLWNDLAAAGLAAVRAANPTRPVLIGPAGSNNIEYLDELVLPDDPNLIATVHFYDPFPFTHQGAEWTQPLQPAGVNWSPDMVDLAPAYRDASWSTELTSEPDQLRVEFAEQWAGFAVDLPSPVDPTALTIGIDGTAEVRVVCADEANSEIDLTPLSTPAGAGTYEIDMTPCSSATTGVFFQNTSANADVIAVTELVVCTERSCDDLVTSAAAAIIDRIDAAARWGDANGRPMHLGEFGAYDGGGAADLADRAAWTKTVQTAARARGMSTAYWEFGAGFGAYDPAAGVWIEPLLAALID